MSEHHKESPSHYNAWVHCIDWDSMERQTSEADAGTKTHKELEKCILDSSYETDSFVARKAYEWIMVSSGTVHLLRPEQRLEGGIEGLIGVYGTTDAFWFDDTDSPHFFDLKTFSDGTEDYSPQLKGYAALWAAADMKRDVKVYLHVFHGGICKCETIECTIGECIDDTRALLGKVREHKSDRQLNKYCQYCKHIKECPMTNNALEVVKENGLTFSKLSLCQKLVILDTVDKLSASIRAEARKIAEASDDKAIEMDGIRYELKPWAGKPKVHDLCEVAGQVAKPKYLKVNEKKQEAVEVEWDGLSGDELLKLCDLSKSALADAIIAKNPKAVKSDVKKYVEQFFDKTEGTPHFVRSK